MNKEGGKIFWSKNWQYAWRTFLVIFLLQNALLFLTTGSFSLLNVVESRPKTEAFQIALLVGILKPLGITVAGFLLAKNLHQYRLRNAFIMGALLGGLWGIIGLVQVGMQLFSNPSLLDNATGRGQLKLILFLPQQIIREGLTGLIGGGIFALYRKIKGS